ncbi:hypothetical protein FACS189440_05560 [Bacteroidia bacterium]|nr:hypothetical protein FACS189423_01470 [Bacteroidia bacterium]GHT46784.1 hypothetical protein FACS189440_05560 [Bacteroidia bacterium]
MKKLNFEQIEKISAGTEIAQNENLQQIDDSLTRNQKCLLLGTIFTGGIVGAVLGQGWGIGVAAAASIAGVINC